MKPLVFKMHNFFLEFSKQLRIYKLTLNNAFATFTTYRSNALFFLVFESLFFFSQLLTVDLSFNLLSGTLDGWSKEEMLLLTVISNCSHHSFVCFFLMPIYSLSEAIWNGKLDFMLLKPQKPLRTLFFTSEVTVSNLPMLVILFFTMIYMSLKYLSSLGGLLSIFAIFLLGMAIRFFMALIFASFSFFGEKNLDPLEGFWTILDLARFPVSIFPKAVEFILTFIFPLVIIANVPASLLIHANFSWSLLLVCFAGIIFCYASYRFFYFSLKSYKSINSGI